MSTAPVIWADSFGSQTLTAYTAFGSNTFSATGGRGSRSCLNLSSSGGSISIQPPGGSGQTLWIMGVAVKPSANNLPAIGFKNSSAGDVAILSNSGGGGFIVTINGTNYGTTPTVPGSVWTQVQFRIFFNGSTGLFDVLLNERSVLSGSGLNTGSAPVAFSATSSIGGGASICDLYVQASTTSADVGFGDRAVMWLPPNGAGASSAWSVTGAASDWQATNESPPDGDTSYISTSSIGDKDTMAMTDLPAGVLSVDGVVAKWVVEKTDAGSRQVAPLWHISGTDYEGTGQVMGTNYAQAYEAYPLNPDTSSAWTISDVNGAELGVELSA